MMTTYDDSDPAGFGNCGDCPECGSLSPWRCGCDVDTMDITDEQIQILATEAAEAGDLLMVAICRNACAGDVNARAECKRVIRNAQAQGD